MSPDVVTFTAASPSSAHQGVERVYFSRGESQCPTCGELFTSLRGFDRHMNPLPQRGCIGLAGLEADPLDRQGRSLYGRTVRTNPGGGTREVWKYQPWHERPAGALGRTAGGM